jgi:hypothetical protein
LARDGTDEAVVPVLEAVLAALVILGVIFAAFVLQRPPAIAPPPAGGPAANAQGIADALAGMTACGGPPATWVDRLEQGDAACQAELDTRIAPMLGDRGRYLVRLANGHGAHTLLPTGAADPDIGDAGVGVLFVAPDWDFPAPPAPAAASRFAPGDERSGAPPACVESPAGTRLRPDGTPWSASWASIVPTDAPYGAWTLYTLGAGSGATCAGATGPSAVLVRFDDTAPLARPAYALQVVVWNA